MPREIPGFYFDAEKKKYFKIQPNHATGQGANHSKQAIKSLEENSRKRKRETHFHLRLQHQTITRSKLLEHPLLGGYLLSRRLDSQNPSIKRRLDLSTLNFTRSLGRTPLCFGTNNRHISAVLYDSFQEYLFTAEVTHGGLTTAFFATRRYGGTQHSKVALSAGLPGEMTSFSINNVSRTLLSTCMGNPGAVRLHQFSSDCRPGDLDALSVSGIDIQFAAATTTFWASQPSSIEPTFVMGSSDGLYLAFAGESSWDLRHMKSRRRAEFLSVEWLDRNVVIGGSRSGEVVFADIRANDDAVTRLAADSAATAVKKLNDSSIVVRTLRRMDVFDLRYAARPSFSGKGKKSGSQKHSAITKPYRSFKGFHAYQKPGGCFDYEPELGIIASGKRFYFRFSATENNAPSLLVAYQDCVEEWSYGAGVRPPSAKEPGTYQQLSQLNDNAPSTVLDNFNRLPATILQE
ncbi:MAG: hypothetical protein Q9227_007942 [Pyrenula ochraceoflavens]